MGLLRINRLGGADWAGYGSCLRWLARGHGLAEVGRRTEAGLKREGCTAGCTGDFMAPSGWAGLAPDRSSVRHGSLEQRPTAVAAFRTAAGRLAASRRSGAAGELAAGRRRSGAALQPAVPALLIRQLGLGLGHGRVVAAAAARLGKRQLAHQLLPPRLAQRLQTGGWWW